MRAKSQVKAVNRFQSFLEQRAIHSQEGPVSPLQISRFETKDTEYGCVWIVAEMDRTGLSETNVLRFLDHEYWHIFIGPKGKIEVKDCPKAYRQFKGRYAFRMFFSL